MPRYRVKFVEEVAYSIEFETPSPLPHPCESDISEGEQGDWFGVMDRQFPGWNNQGAVVGRALLDISAIDPQTRCRLDGGFLDTDLDDEAWEAGMAACDPLYKDWEYSACQ